jgi:hypothetical protein
LLQQPESAGRELQELNQVQYCAQFCKTSKELVDSWAEEVVGHHDQVI